MARKAKQADTRGKFMLVWHDGTSTRFIGSGNKDVPDLVVPPYEKVAVSNHEFWTSNVPFVRDMDSGAIHVDWSNSVPQVKSRTIGDEWGLNPNQKQFAMTVCSTNPLTPQLIENIELRKLLGKGGTTRAGVKVTKQYLQESHRPMLQAILELEGKWANRPDVKELLEREVQGIENL